MNVNAKEIYKILKSASTLFKIKHLEEKFKNNTEYVTVVDFKIEELIKTKLKKSFPTCNFVGEETSNAENGSGYYWAVDPIDGTNNFVKGIPAYMTQIALLNGDNILFSAIYDVNLNNFYHAHNGGGAFLNFKRIFVSGDTLKNGIVTLPDCKNNKPLQLNLYERLYNKFLSLQIHSSAAFDFAMISKGSTICHIIYKHKIWDYAPGYLLAKEAGAIIHEMEKLFGSKQNFLVVANSQTTLDQVLKLLKK